MIKDDGRDLTFSHRSFLATSPEALSAGLGVALDKRGNVVADQKGYASSVSKVWACGDIRRGQSLVVWAIREGRQAAHAVDKALMGETVLPR